MAALREIDEMAQRQWLDWLAGITDGDGVAGFDAAGWSATTWVLHSIYEDRATASQATHDDVRRSRLAAGLNSPLIIGSINLDDESTWTGVSLGMSEPPDGDWVRLRWHDLAARLAIDLSDNDVPPCFRWFPYRSWPVRLDPPDEGSLDEESLEALVDQLAALTGEGRSARCIAYYSPLANGANFDTTWMREVELGDLRKLADQSEGRIGSPSNWWALDKSWMIYTDWDLWATKLSGPATLIAAVESDPRLECVRWEPRQPAG